VGSEFNFSKNAKPHQWATATIILMGISSATSHKKRLLRKRVPRQSATSVASESGEHHPHTDLVMFCPFPDLQKCIQPFKIFISSPSKAFSFSLSFQNLKERWIGKVKLNFLFLAGILA